MKRKKIALIIATFGLATGTIIGAHAMNKKFNETDYIYVGTTCTAITCATVDTGKGACSSSQLYSTFVDTNTCSGTITGSTRWKP